MSAGFDPAYPPRAGSYARVRIQLQSDVSGDRTANNAASW